MLRLASRCTRHIIPLRIRNNSLQRYSTAFTMSEPVQDMGPNGRGPNPEEKLPPLSAMEFSEYNRMADHMNMFVSILGGLVWRYRRRLLTLSLLAQLLPQDLERAILLCRVGHTAQTDNSAPIFINGAPVLPPPDHASYYRRGSRLPPASNQDAGLQEGIGAFNAT